MLWDGIEGHELPRQMLQRALTKDQIAHAYLFHGPDGIGKRTVALRFAKALLCGMEVDPHTPACQRFDAGAHPDLMVVRPEGKSIKIDQIRTLQKELHHLPTEAPRRVAIVEDAHLLGLEAANAFLKLLEEPPAYAVLILISTSLSALVPTIVSRTQPIAFAPLQKDQMAALLHRRGFSAEQVALLTALSGGSVATALTLAEEEVLLHQRDEWLEWLRTHFHLSDIDRLERAEALANEADSLEKRLELLLSVLRDLLCIRLQAPASLLVHCDMTDALSAVAKQYAIERLLQMIQVTKQACQYLKRNGNARLIVDWLLLQWASVE